MTMLPALLHAGINGVALGRLVASKTATLATAPFRPIARQAVRGGGGALGRRAASLIFDTSNQAEGERRMRNARRQTLVGARRAGREVSEVGNNVSDFFFGKGMVGRTFHAMGQAFLGRKITWNRDETARARKMAEEFIKARGNANGINMDELIASIKFDNAHGSSFTMGRYGVTDKEAKALGRGNEAWLTSYGGNGFADGQGLGYGLGSKTLKKRMHEGLDLFGSGWRGDAPTKPIAGAVTPAVSAMSMAQPLTVNVAGGAGIQTLATAVNSSSEAIGDGISSIPTPSMPSVSFDTAPLVNTLSQQSGIFTSIYLTLDGYTASATAFYQQQVDLLGQIAFNTSPALTANANAIQQLAQDETNNLLSVIGSKVDKSNEYLFYIATQNKYEGVSEQPHSKAVAAIGMAGFFGLMKAITVAREAGSNAIDKGMDATSALRESMSSFFEVAKSYTQPYVDLAMTLFKPVIDIFSKWFDWLVENTFVGGLIDLFNNLATAIGGVYNIFKPIIGFIWNAIPYLAKVFDFTLAAIVGVANAFVNFVVNPILTGIGYLTTAVFGLISGAHELAEWLGMGGLTAILFMAGGVIGSYFGTFFALRIASFIGTAVIGAIQSTLAIMWGNVVAYMAARATTQGTFLNTLLAKARGFATAALALSSSAFNSLMVMAGRAWAFILAKSVVAWAAMSSYAITASTTMVSALTTAAVATKAWIVQILASASAARVASIASRAMAAASLIFSMSGAAVTGIAMGLGSVIIGLIGLPFTIITGLAVLGVIFRKQIVRIGAFLLKHIGTFIRMLPELMFSALKWIGKSIWWLVTLPFKTAFSFFSFVIGGIGKALKGLWKWFKNSWLGRALGMGDKSNSATANRRLEEMRKKAANDPEYTPKEKAGSAIDFILQQREKDKAAEVRQRAEDMLARQKLAKEQTRANDKTYKLGEKSLDAQKAAGVGLTSIAIASGKTAASTGETAGNTSEQIELTKEQMGIVSEAMQGKMVETISDEAFDRDTLAALETADYRTAGMASTEENVRKMGDYAALVAADALAFVRGRNKMEGKSESDAMKMDIKTSAFSESHLWESDDNAKEAYRYFADKPTGNVDLSTITPEMIHKMALEVENKGEYAEAAMKLLAQIGGDLRKGRDKYNSDAKGFNMKVRQDAMANLDATLIEGVIAMDAGNPTGLTREDVEWSRAQAEQRGIDTLTAKQQRVIVLPTPDKLEVVEPIVSTTEGMPVGKNIMDITKRYETVTEGMSQEEINLRRMYDTVRAGANVDETMTEALIAEEQANPELAKRASKGFHEFFTGQELADLYRMTGHTEHYDEHSLTFSRGDLEASERENYQAFVDMDKKHSQGSGYLRAFVDGGVRKFNSKFHTNIDVDETIQKAKEYGEVGVEVASDIAGRVRDSAVEGVIAIKDKVVNIDLSEMKPKAELLFSSLVDSSRAIAADAVEATSKVINTTVMAPAPQQHQSHQQTNGGIASEVQAPTDERIVFAGDIPAQLALQLLNRSFL